MYILHTILIITITVSGGIFPLTGIPITYFNIEIVHYSVFFSIFLLRLYVWVGPGLKKFRTPAVGPVCPEIERKALVYCVLTHRSCFVRIQL